MIIRTWTEVAHAAGTAHGRSRHRTAARLPLSRYALRLHATNTSRPETLTSSCLTPPPPQPPLAPQPPLLPSTSPAALEPSPRPPAPLWLPLLANLPLRCPKAPQLPPASVLSPASSAGAAASEHESPWPWPGSQRGQFLGPASGMGPGRRAEEGCVRQVVLLLQSTKAPGPGQAVHGVDPGGLRVSGEGSRQASGGPCQTMSASKRRIQESGSAKADGCDPSHKLRNPCCRTLLSPPGSA